MTSIDIEMDGDNCWPELKGRASEARLTGAALLPDGEVTTITGERKRVPIVTLRFELPDGQIGLAQLKLDMLDTIVRGMRGRLQYLAEQRAAGKADA